jgi:hypothetical protein
LPADVIDVRLTQAQEILEEFLKPVVCIRLQNPLSNLYTPSICKLMSKPLHLNNTQGNEFLIVVLYQMFLQFHQVLDMSHL